MKAILFGGFLAAGKTTALNQVLGFIRGEKPHARVALLINEFGDRSVDTAMFSTEVYQREISGGCICCSLRMALIEQVREIRQTVNPDFLLIEATGLGIPEDILNSIGSIGACESAGILCVDPAHVTLYGQRIPLFSRQLAGADTVLLTKTDLYPPEKNQSILSELESTYPNITIYRSPINALKGLIYRSNSSALGSIRPEEPGQEAPGLGISQKSLVLESPVSLSELESSCRRISDEYGSALLRIKGIIPHDEQWVVFQYYNQSFRMYEHNGARPDSPFIVIIALEKMMREVEPTRLFATANILKSGT